MKTENKFYDGLPATDAAASEALRLYESPAIDVIAVDSLSLPLMASATGGSHDPSGGGDAGHGSSGDGNDDGNNGHNGSGNGGDIGDEDGPNPVQGYQAYDWGWYRSYKVFKD